MPLGGSTLNRKWRLEVNTGTVASPVWTIVYGRTDFKFGRDPQMQDDSDFDSNGYGSQTKTAENWSASGKLSRKVVVGAPTQYDPGQEFIRIAAQQMGAANSIGVRIYEINPNGPVVEAYTGFCAAGWDPDGGGMDALDTVSFTLSGQGQLTSITHPLTAAGAVATITSLSPTTAAVLGGTLITINGSGFSTATSVTVGGTTVTTANWTAVADNKIVMVAPAKTAGSQSVVVINPTGSSTGSPLTYA